MAKIFGIFLFTLIFLSSSSFVKAAVMINEISPSTDPEWIEIFNEDSADVDLAGYLLEDGNTSHSDDLVLSGTISGHGYLVFTHNKGWLNDGGDTLKLYDTSSPAAIIDQYTYGSLNGVSSISRIPNGSENWIVTNTITKGETNPSPTPVPTITISPTPTPTSTPSLTPTPTVSPTIASTPKPTPTKAATATTTPLPLSISTDSGLLEDDKISSDSSVLGVSWEDTETSTKSGVLGWRFWLLKNQNKIIALTFLVLGVSFIGGSIYIAYKTSKSSRSENDI